MSNEYDDLHENDTGPRAPARGERTRTRRRLSEHFTIEEFDCSDGTRVPRGGYWKTLIYICDVYLEPMRAVFGPCTVHSGYRTKAWNAHVGGVSKSFHRYEIHDRDDVAVDVSFERGTPAQWAAKAEEIRHRRRHDKGGIGRYDRARFVHLDTRDTPANWFG